MATKSWKIRTGAITWTAERKARLYVNDRGSGCFGETFNRIELAVDFKRPYANSDEYESATLWLAFQRDNRVDGVPPTRLAAGPLDTKLRWGASYAGRIGLNRADYVAIADRPFTLEPIDVLAVAAARQLARTIKTYNIWALTECECAKVMAALDKLGCYVESYYGDPSRSVELHEVTDRFANARHESEQRRIEREMKLAEAARELVATVAGSEVVS